MGSSDYYRFTDGHFHNGIGDAVAGATVAGGTVVMPPGGHTTYILQEDPGLHANNTVSWQQVQPWALGEPIPHDPLTVETIVILGIIAMLAIAHRKLTSIARIGRRA